MSDGQDLELLKQTKELRDRLLESVHRRIVGQESALEGLLVVLLGQGHGLITGVPGLGKTLMIRTLADAMDLGFSRIQFTPDLMPSDVTGTEVIEEDRSTGQRRFKFVQGPVFTNLLLADEVNRTPPKTQAALLQAMQESIVTVMGRTHALDQPFHVFATQNPIEHEGTYPLPEAFLDRFMLSIHMDYPTQSEEEDIVRLDPFQRTVMEKVISQSRLKEAQGLLGRMPVSDHVVQLVVRLARASRPGKDASDLVNEYVSWGTGPRAAQNLLQASKARAALDGEPTPVREHVLKMAIPVLRHRLVLNFRAETDRVQPEDVLADLVKAVG